MDRRLLTVLVVMFAVALAGCSHGAEETTEDGGGYAGDTDGTDGGGGSTRYDSADAFDPAPAGRTVPLLTPP